MKLSRDLVHAIDFSKAPTDVKAAAKAYVDSSKRLRKAQEQQAKWRDELKKASVEAERSYQTLEDAAITWEPTSSLEVI